MVDKGQVTEDIEAAIVDRNSDESKDSAPHGTSIIRHLVAPLHECSSPFCFVFVFQTSKVQPELLKVLLSNDFF